MCYPKNGAFVGEVAVWEAAFNVNEKGQPSAMGLT
jgi:hypothetical protein